MYAAELSGEHPALARAEAEAAARALDGAPVNADLERVQLALSVDAPSWAGRLALAWRIVDVHAKSDVDVEAIVEAARDIELAGSSFAVRCSRLVDGLEPELAEQIQREVGAALDEDYEVDLENPDDVVRVLLDREAVIGREAATVDRSGFEDRHVEKRPDHSPVTLHPRLARAMVNLTEAPPGGRLWDPFAGTGGIALEAALLHVDTLASDVDADMVQATQNSLEHVDATGAVVQGDFQDVADSIGLVDAVVTDPPYGRASTTNDEDVEALYERFFAVAAGALRPGGRLVVAVPDADRAKLAPLSLREVERFEWYVHQSLTRYIFVFERKRHG